MSASMKDPTVILGVEMMDRDHLRIERMFEAVSRTPDEDLPALHRDVATELAAHFAREADFLRENQVPGLHCHVAQHNELLAEMARGEHPKSGYTELRRRLQVIMPQLVLSHVATMDRMAAAFLKGELQQSDFDGLRLALPEPEPAK
jgi:hemerythrin-like metal-binding protein